MASQAPKKTLAENLALLSAFYNKNKGEKKTDNADKSPADKKGNLNVDTKGNSKKFEDSQKTEEKKEDDMFNESSVVIPDPNENNEIRFIVDRDVTDTAIEGTFPNIQ